MLPTLINSPLSLHNRSCPCTWTWLLTPSTLFQLSRSLQGQHDKLGISENWRVEVTSISPQLCAVLMFPFKSLPCFTCGGCVSDSRQVLKCLPDFLLVKKLRLRCPCAHVWTCTHKWIGYVMAPGPSHIPSLGSDLEYPLKQSFFWNDCPFWLFEV